MKSALKKLGDPRGKDMQQAAPYAFTASSAGDIKFNNTILWKEQSAQIDFSSSSSSSSGTTYSSAGGCELSSFAASGTINKPAKVSRLRFKRSDSPRVCARAASDAASCGGSCRSSSDTTSSDSSFSVPYSETHWLQLPTLKPLINPNRLQALRLCTRDHRIPSESGDSAVVSSPSKALRVHFAQARGQNHNSFKSQQTLTGSYVDNDVYLRQNLQTPRKNADVKRFDAASCAWSENVSCGGRSELRMADSTNSSRRAIYQFSFRVPETKANMRAFSDSSDRRVEAIARACDSEILLDPEPIRATNSMKLRRVTIRAPDPHCLEKCCRMFDDKFPHFYASGGLGPCGSCISKVYDDVNEKYISRSNDELS